MKTHPLYVVAVISNPARFESRYRLYKEFAARMHATTGVVLVTVEHAFGTRPHFVTEAHNKLHVQLRGGPEHELWLKENMINIGFRHILRHVDPRAQYLAWIDADVQYADHRWALETVEQLQHYAVVQAWSHVVDFGPKGEVAGLATSFGFDYAMGNPAGWIAAKTPAYTVGTPKGINTWHPGYAWAMRRDTYESLGGIVDWCVLGSGDHHMAYAFIDAVDKSIHGGTSPGYKAKLHEWAKKCTAVVKRDLGYVPATINHHWHGKKRERFYQERWSILVDSKFDPYVDVAYDHQGVLTLTGRNLVLRDGLRKYFRSRNEDSIDLE